MEKLNFPSFQPKIKKYREGSYAIYDPIRKKHIDLTPEEWVRQHILNWLIKHERVKAINISVEKSLDYNGLIKRYDVLTYKQGKPFLLIECKATNIQLSDDTCQQIARYNKQMQVPYLMISNGINSYLFQYDTDSQDYLSTKNIVW